MTYLVNYIFCRRTIVLLLFNCICFGVFAQTDTSTVTNDSLHYPIKDRRGDRYTWQNKNPFNIRDTSLLKQEIEYDPITKRYYIIEKIGNKTYRTPTYLTFEEFQRIQAKKAEVEYFKNRAQALTSLNRKISRPKMRVFDKLFDRIFGLGKDGFKVNIKPQGSVDILAGYQGQVTKNPTLPEAARKNGGFDFDMNANLNVNANIGDKLKLPINYNTLANFDFENQLKLDYKGMDDEILKSVEAGNISWQSKGTLIPSTQNLFGLKTQLQFGKLFITGAIANQRSQRQSQNLQGGTATTPFQKKLDDYEENRHFLMGQYFRNNFNASMAKLPIVNSLVQIQRIEVWITNRTGATTDARDIVGFADLGEATPYNPVNLPGNGTPSGLPGNQANALYGKLVAGGLNSPYRQPSQVTSSLQAMGLKPVDDFEKTYARKLSTNEYYFNPQIGFISINAQLQPDEVLAVAYQYTYNGQVYQVGEFSQDIALDSSQGVQKVLFLKLLKATSARVNLPIWGLMMKNVYSLDLPGISREDFQLNVLYEEPSGGLKRYLPESSTQAEGKSLLRVLNLDRLNNRNDPQPDGQFDYIEGYTILPQQGKIIFPVLEPFGKDLYALAFNNGNNLPPGVDPSKYIYQVLYDSIKAIAQTYANFNKYVMQGQAKGTGGSDIYLGAFNIPQGSVTINAGGQVLVEGVDYTIDYNLGSVKIINQAILNSGIPVSVSYENNAGFGMQQRGFFGLRADYLASKKLSLGVSMVRLSERPFFTKMNYGEDPIRNTMYGFDFSYRSEVPSLTRLLNKLPFYSTSAKSTITAYGEAAYLKPGHPKQIGKGNEGLIYIDDFEGTRNSYDLRFPSISWALASTPSGRFPEANLFDSIDYNFNRAKLAWYNIEPNLQDKNAANNPLRKNLDALSDPRTRQVYTNELFPNLTTNITNVQAFTFDLAYYPTERGPYNYVSNPSQVNASGKLSNPKQRWGGIMRSIDQTDFETGNVEYIEFWVQDPFIKTTNPLAKGKLYINLGNVSEDILKDGKRFYENGLPSPKIPAVVDSSTWGKQPINPIQVTQAFSNDPDDRPYQDVGFDGMTDEDEKRRKAYYIDRIAANFSTNSPIYIQASQDPSNDNYKWYRDGSYDAVGADILQRYKNFNNPQGNSPIAGTNSELSAAATLYPDNEDLNRDNTLNETESYYEYEIDLSKNMDAGITKYITDKRAVNVNYVNGTTGVENWYLFRVPIKDYSSSVGGITDFKSIRFIRMYLTDFEDSVVLRFAKLDLVRNQWRNFNYKVDTTGQYVPVDNNTTSLNILAVNLEENSNRTPVNYVMPPGIERVQVLSNNGVNLLQNEQSMSLKVMGLKDGDARGVIKTLNLDMRQYGKLSMFIHAESVPKFPIVQDDELNAVVRIGQDFLNNYYEIKVPLKITLPGKYNSSDSSAEKVWPTLNNLDFELQELVNLKLRRNSSGNPLNKIYREIIGNKTFSVYGNPNLGEVRGILIAVENAKDNNPFDLYTEVWVNELRLSQLDERGAYAALGRIDVQLADLGSVSFSANTYSKGFGTIEQRVNERAGDNMFQFDAAATIDAGKLVPKKAKITIPIYASINKTIKRPEYDPYDKDVKLKDKLNNATSSHQRDSIKSTALDQTTIKTINFTNIRVQGNGKNHLWSLSNFDLTYSYTKTEQSSPIVLKNEVTKQRGAFGYTFNKPSNYIEPFKKLLAKRKSKWYDLIKDFNFNPMPSLLSFRVDINRQFGQYIPRIVSTDGTGKIERVDTTYDKYFTFDRFYNLRWDLTRSLNIDFNATNNARVDEPEGIINTKEKRDSIRTNFWNGGRNTLYNQRATASYTVPLSKLPITDWITTRYSYTTTYNWVGASLLALSLGNVIENSQENLINAEFDFIKLYSKSRWLRALDNAPPPSSKGKGTKVVTPNRNPSPTIQIKTKAEVIKGLKGKKKREAIRKWRQQKRDARLAKRLQKQNQPVEMNDVVRTTGRIATMVKRASLNYNETYHTRLPGYMDGTRQLGNNFKTMQPGLDFVFGMQPDTNWLNKKAAEGVFTKDSVFNSLFRQNFEQRLAISVQAEPIKELTIDLNLDKTFSKEFTELFKDVNATGKYNHLNPYAAGGFNVSYISFSTLFNKADPNEISETFKKFQSYRTILSKRVAESNPYWNGQFDADGYAIGYGRYAQDVLIPSFIAAYTGKDPSSVSLLNQNNKNIRSNPFSGIKPKPNWRVTYTGLTRIPALAKKFSTISLSHAYNGSLGMNSYNSALLFADPFHFGAPQFIDTISGNFVPFFLVPNITIQEQFAPLIGIDVTTLSQVNFKFEYKKSRQLSLSLVDYQLSETNSTEWVIGGSWRKRGLSFIKIKGKALENDINFKLDLSMRDDITTNSRLDQANAYGTGGQKVITIQPSIDYVLNNRINITLFFDQRRVIPYISTSAPTINTRAGLQIRVALAP
ncbi:MAG: cell surface protein SprA [Chitinophagales bacterium]|nr:cell surface protein SprA [Chitinophagales bacterium]